MQVYLKFTVGLAVTGTSQMFSETVSIAPNPPKLTIEGPGKIQNMFTSILRIVCTCITTAQILVCTTIEV